MKETFGNFHKEIRKRNRYSAPLLEPITGVSKSMYSLVERGKGAPNERMVQGALRLFDMTEDERTKLIQLADQERESVMLPLDLLTPEGREFFAVFRACLAKLDGRDFQRLTEAIRRCEC